MAKFKSTTLGGAGLMKKAKRFQSSLSNPVLIQPKHQALPTISQTTLPELAQSVSGWEARREPHLSTKPYTGKVQDQANTCFPVSSATTKSWL